VAHEAGQFGHHLTEVLADLKSPATHSYLPFSDHRLYAPARSPSKAILIRKPFHCLRRVVKRPSADIGLTPH
jgi:hypothetical protein